MESQIRTKDLITIRIFSAIYLITYIVFSSVLFTPVLFMFMMPIGALLLGPVYMLYIARTQKPGAITIMGLLIATIAGLLVYGNILVALVNFGFALVAELLAYLGKYKRFVWLTMSYAVMSLWVLGQQAPWWVAQDWIRELTIASGYSAEWTDETLAFATPLNLVLIIGGTIICAVVSSFIANRMLKKHFVRAGIA
ncbi:MAG: MptD family putative ECF transporter S component [Chloroflexota bacterium]